jgi:hypothetical protein
MPYVEIVCYGADIDNGLVEIKESGRVSEYYVEVIYFTKCHNERLN